MIVRPPVPRPSSQVALVKASLLHYGSSKSRRKADPYKR